ncbi:RHS repeat-associated core domain-containing protein [Streptomyces sp. b94]|uniref:RHS repeat-associated core domain-containing protein n=1 Tax=Streptomyces sp. b94 TaxID=1827634 RepID=UPI0035AB7E41
MLIVGCRRARASEAFRGPCILRVVPSRGRHERCRHRVHPRAGGHAELRDDWGEVLLLPHRRHRQRPRPRRRRRQAHAHLRLRPHRPLAHHTHGDCSPAVPLRGRVRRPDRPLQDGPPLLRPTLGRFTQPDPSGQETNPYLYAAGDSINNTDPTGLASAGEWTIGVLGVVGGVATVAAAVATGPVALVAGGISLATAPAATIGTVACLLKEC